MENALKRTGETMTRDVSLTSDSGGARHVVVSASGAFEIVADKTPPVLRAILGPERGPGCRLWSTPT
jgi:hypothetical protein